MCERYPYAAPRSATDPYHVSWLRISARRVEPVSIFSAENTPGSVVSLVPLILVGRLSLFHLFANSLLCSFDAWKILHFAFDVVSILVMSLVISRLRRDAPVLLGMILIHVPPGLSCLMYFPMVAMFSVANLVAK